MTVWKPSESPDMRCALGMGPFAFAYPNEFGLTLSKGHGVRVYTPAADPDTGQCGMLAPETDTLIDGPGGLHVALGSKVVHDAESCAQGIEQAGR